MAITATISTSPSSTAVTEQKVTASVVISNSGAFQVQVTSMEGLVKPTGSGASNYNSGVAVGVINTGPNANLTVPAAGSLTLTFDLRFHGPSTASSTNQYVGTGSNTYDVSAVVYTDDGSVTSPTASTITVNYAVTYNSSQS